MKIYQEDSILSPKRSVYLFSLTCISLVVSLLFIVSCGTSSTPTNTPKATDVPTTTGSSSLWQLQNSGTGANLANVAWSGSQFVAVGEGGTILTSPDGITWTSVSVPGVSTISLSGVIWAKSQFVAVGDRGTIFTSSDGKTWTPRHSGTNNLQAVDWSGSQFVAVGDKGTILTSSDGMKWTSSPSGTEQGLKGVTWGVVGSNESQRLFVIVGKAGTILTGSP